MNSSLGTPRFSGTHFLMRNVLGDRPPVTYELLLEANQVQQVYRTQSMDIITTREGLSPLDESIQKQVLDQIQKDRAKKHHSLNMKEVYAFSPKTNLTNQEKNDLTRTMRSQTVAQKIIDFQNVVWRKLNQAKSDVYTALLNDPKVLVTMQKADPEVFMEAATTVLKSPQTRRVFQAYPHHWDKTWAFIKKELPALAFRVLLGNPYIRDTNGQSLYIGEPGSEDFKQNVLRGLDDPGPAFDLLKP